MYRFMDPGGFHHGPGVLGWLIFAALVALIAIGVALVVHRWRPGSGSASTIARSSGDPSGDSALAEVRLRYARGELTREQYFERLADLEGHRDTAKATVRSD